MTDFINEIRNRHDLFYKVFLFLSSIFLIVYLFPKEATFKYNFQRNQPWKYETLTAPYDIPVYRTETEIEKNRKEVIRNKKFYFDFDQQKAQEKENMFVRSPLGLRFSAFAKRSSLPGLKGSQSLTPAALRLPCSCGRDSAALYFPCLGRCPRRASNHPPTFLRYAPCRPGGSP